jgi:ankyrin repeat protein
MDLKLSLNNSSSFTSFEPNIEKCLSITGKENSKHNSPILINRSSQERKSKKYFQKYELEASISRSSYLSQQEIQKSLNTEFQSSKTIPINEGQSIQLNYSETEKKVSGWFLNRDGATRQIKNGGIPRELHNIPDVNTFEALLGDAYAKAKILSNGEIKFSIHQTGKGSMKKMTEQFIGINIQTQDDLNAFLLKAAAEGNLEEIKKLLAVEANIEAKDSQGYTALDWIVGLNHVKAVKILHWAAAEGHVKIIQSLLNYQVNIEAKDSQGKTALFWAAEQGKIEAIKVLISNGANIEARDNNGGTMLDVASSYGRTEVIKVLLDYKASMRVHARPSTTVLHKALIRGEIEAFEVLIASGVNIEAKDEYNQTPLHLVCSFGTTKAIYILLSVGANIEAKDEYDQTPLHLACSYGKAEAIHMLLSSGVNINAQNAYGQTALHLAGFYSKIEAINILLSGGANIEIKDFFGRTARYWAPMKIKR